VIRPAGRAAAGRPPGAAPAVPRPPSRLPKVPEMTIRRLSIYSRCLAQLEEDGVKTVSSQELAERFHLNSAQVRKDLAYFGEFGVRGIGYYVSSLRAELQRILGLDREWRVVLVGFGNLGSALFHYRGFARQGFRIVAVVDDDPAKMGRLANGLTILPLGELPRVVRSEGIQIGVIAVPAEAAQLVADRLVAAGVRAILNFAPVRLKVPKEVRLQHVDLSIELEHLSFHLAQGTR
jgi:redox-sensing transcriptional repressor